jgi:hypothetical protein
LQFLKFRILRILQFCVLPRSAHPRGERGRKKRGCVIFAERRDARRRSPAHTCLLRQQTCAVDVLSFEAGTPCRQTTPHRPRYRGQHNVADSPIGTVKTDPLKFHHVLRDQHLAGKILLNFLNVADVIIIEMCQYHRFDVGARRQFSYFVGQ